LQRVLQRALFFKFARTIPITLPGVAATALALDFKA
jgi:hypothetical protein